MKFVCVSEWYWRCKVYFWVMRVCGVILAVVTFMVVWSECLFFVKDPVLSLFAVFINAAKHNYDYVFIEVNKRVFLTTRYLKCISPRLNLDQEIFDTWKFLFWRTVFTWHILEMSTNNSLKNPCVFCFLLRGLNIFSPWWHL